ncbi:TOBE domain-containing protein [Hydrogenobacter hydrogenophilus]|uniref:TOBE domain-containing protein n=1 Tax=Hydrogenobacter hydrogenophilus TaxID=35835 RepID=A0A285NV28_9AQUI|nr:TOBE domain-containing protein [Hydrogenobacter hydrogenophilus]SNZ13330.1 TOBE domain-containing protein [Hydrogenobacter hydrogenophilus]
MNLLRGRVEKVEFDHGISHVEVSTHIGTIHSVVLEERGEGAGFIKESSLVDCFFNETSPVLTQEPIANINTFDGVVKGLEVGKVLCMVHVEKGETTLKVLLLKQQVDLLGLSEGKKVFIFLPPWHVALEVVHE